MPVEDHMHYLMATGKFNLLFHYPIYCPVIRPQSQATITMLYLVYRQMIEADRGKTGNK